MLRTPTPRPLCDFSFPSSPRATQTAEWAYIAWFEFDWGEGGDPDGAASVPRFDQLSAQELYSHTGDIGSSDIAAPRPISSMDVLHVSDAAPAASTALPLSRHQSSGVTTVGGAGDLKSGETFEWENLAYESSHAATVATLHKQLIAIVKTGLVKPMNPPAHPLGSAPG